MEPAPRNGALRHHVHGAVRKVTCPPLHKLCRRTSETRIGPLPIANRGEENTSGADPKARPAGVAVLVLPF